MKKAFLFFSSILFLTSFIHAQSVVEISMIEVRYRYQVENEPPVSVFDPAYQDRKVEMDITFTVNNPKEIKEVAIKNGLQNGSAEYLNSTLQYLKSNGKEYLSYNGKIFEIENNRVTITQEVSEESSRKTTYVSIKATDKAKQSNTASKKIN
jgi:hypothetical protein